MAWHTDMDGYYDGHAYHCYACTALRGEDTVYHSVTNTRPAEKPLSLFELGVTTFTPDPD